MELTVQTQAKDGRLVNMTAAQAQAIEAMTNTRKGGFATIVGYCPSSSWVKRPIQDIQMICHFSTTKLYERRLKALQAIRYEDVAVKVAQDEKFGQKTAAQCLEIFNARKGMQINSIERNLEGAPKNAHAEAHDRCYAHIGDVKVHLIAEKVDGVMKPVLSKNGSVSVASIMVPYLELKTTTRVEGERKKVNSGAPVLMGKFIESALNKRSIQYKTLSLKSDNFEAFHIDRQQFLPEHVTKFGDLI